MSLFIRFTGVQHGFRKTVSTITLLVEVIHEWSSAGNKRGEMDEIYWDFSKASGRVSHKKIAVPVDHNFK